jgi:outer membrane lipoprotein-sorting protein
MTKKKLILYIVALLTIFPLVADAAKKQSGTAILDRVASKINISKGASMSFSISSAKINQSGTIAVKGTKFCAKTSLATIWYDGKTQWTYNKKTDEVNIASPSASQQQSMNPYTFLYLYKKGYSNTVEKNKNGYVVHLVGKGKSISEMYVTVDSRYNLKQIKMKQGNNWMTISVSNVKNVNLSDSAFRFNSKEYPKAEIIDLR